MVTIPIIAAIAFVLVFGTWATTLIRQYQKGLLETFGKYSRTLTPGLHFIIPMVQRVRKVDMRERTLDVPRQDVITQDNASVTVDAIVYYKPTDAKKVEYEVEDFEQAAVRLAQTNLRSEIGEMDLDQSLSSRETINSKLLTTLDEETDKWGVKVTKVEIREITPPDDVKDAMAQQLKAERRRRAEVLKAEGVKQASVLEAEGGKKAAILEAEGEAEARQRKADAKRYEYITEAEGEANAIQGVFGAYHNGKPNEQILTLKAFEALEKLAQGRASKLIVPSGAADVLGAVSSLTGISDEDGFPDFEDVDLSEEEGEDLVQGLADKANQARERFHEQAEEIRQQAEERAEQELEEEGGPTS